MAKTPMRLPPSPDRLDPETRSKLEQAGSHYRSALALAEVEDERLETQAMGAIVRNRLRQLETMTLVPASSLKMP
jgi:hypothetical protein